MISITDQAAKKIGSLMAKHPEADGLRVSVRGGGCSGMQYEFSVDAANDRDKAFEQRGVKVLVDPKSLLYIKGSELDYSTDLLRAGFEMRNPNVKSTCGCGVSFNI